MNFKKLLLTTTALFTGALLNLSAQNFEGVITYNIIYEDLSEAMAQYESMLPKEQVTKIKGEKTKTVQKGGMAGSNTTLTDAKEGTTTILIDQMGMKKYYQVKNEEMEKEEDQKEPEIKYSDETKEIAGYECKRAELTIDATTPPMIIYYTEDIEAAQTNEQFSKLKGFPLEYEISTPNFRMILSAKNVDETKVSKGEFKIPSEYEEMTKEEFQQMQRGG